MCCECGVGDGGVRVCMQVVRVRAGVNVNGGNGACVYAACVYPGWGYEGWGGGGVGEYMGVSGGVGVGVGVGVEDVQVRRGVHVEAALF